MSRDKLILGVDLSTSCAGFSIFKLNGELIELTHAQPKHDFKFSEKMEDLYYKGNMLKNFIISKGWAKMRIVKIVIEAPMISAGTILSSALLNKFHGIFYSALRDIYGDKVEITYIPEREARCLSMPEIIGLNDRGKEVMWGSIPKEIRGHKISKYRKFIVMLQMAKRFPDVKWMLTNNKTVNQKNFDQADSLATALGYLVQTGAVESNKIELESSIQFIEKYYDYLEWMKSLEGSASEKKALKVHYLNEYLNVNDHLNMNIFI